VSTFVLIHSPLVGPTTWAPVADALRAAGHTAVVPSLENVSAPYWAGHASAVARALDGLVPGERIVLVGHSGAGPLLPSIGQAAGRPVAAYVFVDADLPREGASRLDLFATVGDADAFRRSARDGVLPPWGESWPDGAWERLVPDGALRGRFRAELRAVALAVYEEPLPVFDGWPDSPCAYLKFSPVYDGAAAAARETGWAYRELAGLHLHMLVDPAAVAGALIDLARDCKAP